MRRLAAGLWSGFWLLVILVVPPWAMLVWFGWPVPRQPLDQPHLHEWIIAAGVLIAWLLWAILVAVIATETVRAVHRIRLPTLRVTAPPEGFLTGLISAVVVAATSTAARGTLPAATPTPTVATVPQPPPGPTASTADTRANLSMRQAADRVGTAKLAARAQVDAGQVTLVVAGQHYTYTVRRGDTLSHIAAAWLGDPDRWPEIYHLNKGRHFPDVGGTLHNPNLIYPGWILDLPGDAHPPAGTPSAPATGPGGAPPVASKPAPASPPAAGVHHDLDPMPSTPSAASPPAAPAPAGTPATPPAPPAGAPADHDTHRPGVELPGGGWVAAPLAGAVAAAAALVWIHRRRRYRPRPPTGTVRADPDLTPLPETVAILQAAAPRPTREDTMADRAPETAEAATVTPAALGTHAQQTLHLTDLPPHGLGLTGPGAPNAARGLLAAVLSAGGPWAADHEATLLTTTADLNTLLGTDTDPTRFRLDRLHIAATVNHALDDLERHLLHRARFAAEHDTADLTTELSDPDPQPPIVLLTTAPTGNTATRLTTILTVGSRLAITGVLIGAWPDGATWHVNTDGTTHPEQQPDTNGPRLNTLDAAAVVDILQTLVQAHPSDDALMSSLTAAAPAAHAATPARGESPPTPARPAAERAAAPTPSADAATPTARRLRLTVLGRPSGAATACRSSCTSPSTPTAPPATNSWPPSGPKPARTTPAAGSTPPCPNYERPSPKHSQPTPSPAPTAATTSTPPTSTSTCGTSPQPPSRRQPPSNPPTTKGF